MISSALFVSLQTIKNVSVVLEKKFSIVLVMEVSSLLEIIFVNLLYGMLIKTKKINIQMSKELTLEFTTPAYRSILLDKWLLISLISLVHCILIKLLTAASVNPSCFTELISYPHLIWAAVDWISCMGSTFLQSIICGRIAWSGFHFGYCGTQLLVLQQCCCWCYSKHWCSFGSFMGHSGEGKLLGLWGSFIFISENCPRATKSYVVPYNISVDFILSSNASPMKQHVLSSHFSHLFISGLFINNLIPLKAWRFGSKLLSCLSV